MTKQQIKKIVCELSAVSVFRGIIKTKPMSAFLSFLRCEGGIDKQLELFGEFVYLLALISLSLGVTNLLPIPPLDGWKIVVYLIEAIRRKPLDEKTQMNIDALGFVFMIVLSLYVAYNDILRL